MKDIESRRNIEKLLESFYEKAFSDETIGYIFTDIAKLDLIEHMPIIADFWEMVLFQTVNFQEKYGRSPMQRHIELNKKETLKSEHFQKWLQLFDQAVDENFSGEKAELAKLRARAIAKTMFLMVSEGNSKSVKLGQD